MLISTWVSLSEPTSNYVLATLGFPLYDCCHLHQEARVLENNTLYTDSCIWLYFLPQAELLAPCGWESRKMHIESNQLEIIEDCHPNAMLLLYY